MRRCAIHHAAVVLTALVLLGFPAAVRAEFTTPTLLSGAQALQIGSGSVVFPQPLQFEEAEAPAFAREGSYVVFRGALAGIPGLYRRDLQTGEVALVAGEAPAGHAEALPAAPDASAPSISAEGRYIAFTSAATLVPICGTPAAAQPDQAAAGCEPEADRGCPQVYVRDMGQPGVPTSPATPGAFTLVSARDGSGEGLTYSGCHDEPSPQLTLAGAQVATGVALSANGREVAFTVLSPSNLDGSCTASTSPTCSTEASQVAVRDTETKSTTLVTVTPSGQPTPGGGAYPSTVSEHLVRLVGVQPGASSAAISADGSAVAWEGTNVPAQVLTATDVSEGMARSGGPASEVEPLWRRVGDGPLAETRRLLAGAGLNFYGFAKTNLGEGEPPVRGGALAYEPQEQDEFIPPAISEHGETVATIANAFTPANEASYEFVSARLVPPAEAYVVHVSNDPAVAPDVTPLTATPNYAIARALYGGVSDIAISPDGSHVAFNTRRVSFALAPPNLISTPVAEADNAYTYSIDLTTGIMQRVATGYEGSPPDGAPSLISLAGDDLSLTFASAASNLIYGDGAPGASQVYLTQEVPPPSELALESISAEPMLPMPAPAWVLSATATPQKNGAVLVDAQVPGAGKLDVLAQAQLPAKHGPGKVRRARGTVRKASVARAKLVTRTIARGLITTGVASELQLRMRAASAYRGLVSARSGLYVVLRVSFTAPGHQMLVRQIPVTLRDSDSSKARGYRKAAKKSAAARPGSGAHT